MCKHLGNFLELQLVMFAVEIMQKHWWVTDSTWIRTINCLMRRKNRCRTRSNNFWFWTSREEFQSNICKKFSTRRKIQRSIAISKNKQYWSSKFLISEYKRKRIRKNPPKRRRAEDLILRGSIDSLKLRC